MVFSTMTFLTIALPLVLGVYYLLPRRLRNGWLLVFSLAFYGWGGPAYLALMLVSITCNYLCGLSLGRAGSTGARRGLLALALAVNLGALFAFKYLGFCAATVNRLLGLDWTVPRLTLPIGISFYTFQALSYVIDVYRGDVPVQRSWARLALYITFFPQLIAGPILRYDAVEPQIASRHETLEGFWYGLKRFAMGLGKKVLIANTVAVVADEAFSTAGLSAAGAWVGALAYALQILFDFSGYSDMAIGLGAMFGFTYPENFNAPYTAVTVRDFWRRWHISLSTWFRDYLYIPLGGSRAGRGRHVLNLLIVFFATGIWHGAGFTYLVWGLYYGALSALGVLLGYRPSERMPVRAAQRALTLLFVLVGWVVFRAESMTAALAYLKGMVAGGGRGLYTLTPRAVGALALGCLLSSSLPRRALNAVKPEWRERLSLAAVPALLMLCMLSLASGAYNPFIYFQF